MAELNTQFPGLETLFQNLPAAGYFQSGQMQGIAQENNVRQQQAFDAEQAQKASERPLQLDQLFQQNQAAKQANQGTALDLERKQASQGLNIDVDKKLLQNKVTAADLDKMTAHGQMYSNFGSTLSQLPAAARGSAAMQFMQQNGINDPQAMKLIQAGDPRVADYFTKVGQGIYEVQSKTREALQLNKTTNDTHLQTAQIGANATLGAAKIGADSRAEVAAAKAKGAGASDIETIIAKQAPATKRATLLDMANRARLRGDSDAAEQYAQRAQDPDLIKQIQAQLAAGGAQQTAVNPSGGLDTTTRQSQVDIGGPKPQAKDPMSLLPQGSKNNGDGTFTLPNGKVVRPKQG